jgi:outer membrane protein assembly factor BamB
VKLKKPYQVLSDKTLNLISIYGTAIIGLIAFIWWFTYDPVSNFSLSLPGLDNRPESFVSGSEQINIGAYFASFNGIPSTISGSWPRFRGEDFDNISKEKIKLASNWGDTGPTELWSVDLGEGHSGPVISQGRVYLMDYDEENRRDILRCFSLDDGKEIWQRGYDIYIKRNHGMSRTVPAVQDNYVVTMGPMCQLMCVTADSGNFLWGIDISQQFESEVPLWYTGQCPLIDDSVAVIAIGGTSLMIGVTLDSGKVIWNTPNPNKYKMSHSSVIPMTIHDTKMYVYSAIGGLIGISAEEENIGEVLFETNKWNHTVVAPSPVHVGNNKIFVTAGYGAGSMLFQVNKEKDVYTIEPTQSLKPDEGLAAEQQTPILYNGYLFSILPKDAGSLRNQFVCCLPEDCSKIVWFSGKTNRYGLGPYILADGKFFILSDDGVLTVAEANTEEFIILSQIKILNGHDAWGPLAIVKGRLLARDSRRMVCLDIRAKI